MKADLIGWALICSDTASVALLLEYGAEPGEHTLPRLVATPAPEPLALLLSAFPAWFAETSASPLVPHFGKLSVPVARILLDYGLPLQRDDGAWHRYLHDAVEVGDSAVVKLLLDHGVPVDARAFNGVHAALLAPITSRAAPFDRVVAVLE